MRGKITGLVVGSAVIMLAASSAFAGTATFEGSLNDTDAQLAGDLVAYLPLGIDSTCADGCDWARTTNLTSLCGGAKTLAAFGTFTIVFKEPMWNWTSWWGSWLTLELSDGVDVQVSLGIAPPFTWSEYPAAWLYGNIGTVDLAWTGEETGVPTECWDAVLVSMDDWDPCLDGNRPVALRISSDGTDLTFSSSNDGETFTQLPGASWAINSMPGGLGDMTAEDLSIEIAGCSNITEIRKIEWTADSVPMLNQDPVPGCMGDADTTYECLFDDFTISYYPTFSRLNLEAPDHNWDGVPDPYQLALVAAAICEDPEVEAVYQANLALASSLIEEDYWGWGVEPPNWATQIAAEAMWDDTQMAIQWYFWIFDHKQGTFESLPELTAAGDYDGDGVSNADECAAAIAGGGSPADFVAAATNYWDRPGDEGLPVAGLFGLGLLAGASVLGGVLTLRRNKK